MFCHQCCPIPLQKQLSGSYDLLKYCGLAHYDLAKFRPHGLTRDATMNNTNGKLGNESLSEENCRIDQIVDGFLDNTALVENRSCGVEAAKFAEMVVLNELIFGSPSQAIQELVETRALRKIHRRPTGSTLS